MDSLPWGNHFLGLLMTISRRTYLKSNATSDSTAPSSSKNLTLIPASTTGVSSAVLSDSLIESSPLSEATALQSYTTASGPSASIPQPSSHVFMPSPQVYTTVPSAAFSPLYTMSSNASPQSFPSTYQNPSSFSPAPLLAAPISGPFHVPLNSSVMPKEGLISTPLIVLGFVDQSTAKEMKLKFDIQNNRKAFVTSISDSKTVPSFEELRTKVLNQESRLHRIQAAQHSEQQSAFVSQTSAASDNRSSRSNYNGARNNNGRNQQLILRIALPSPYSQVTLTSSPHLSVTDPLPLATNKDSQELWDCLRGLNPLDSVFRQEHLPPCYPPRERGFLEYLFQCAHASDEPSCVIKHFVGSASPEWLSPCRDTSHSSPIPFILFLLPRLIYSLGSLGLMDKEETSHSVTQLSYSLFYQTLMEYALETEVKETSSHSCPVRVLDFRSRISKSLTVKERNERARARERLDGMNWLSLRALSQRSY
ncbi:hypothetical protein Tco_0697858 [Tanacetum coccineum]